MGQEERAAMFLQLDSVVKELKEQKWKLSQVSRTVGELDLFLKGERFEEALAVLERSERRLVVDDLHALLQTIVKLEGQRVSLEKSLGVKFALE